jgi:SEC-C motif domain protein
MDAMPCACGRAETYETCCGRYHRGDAQAPSAERLMRTWHPSTRPPRVDFDPTLTWDRLEIVGTTGGGMLDSEGTVRFRAHYLRRRRAGHLEENSRFVLHDGAWAYVGPLPLG